MGRQHLTLTEKIATLYAVGLGDGGVARSGEIITIRPKHVMTHDNTSAVMAKFATIGAARICNPKQPVFAIDHDIQNLSAANLGKYARIEKFAREQGVDFYPAGTGISHQVMVEQGYVTPGALVVGSDSHSNLYGALSALGTPVVRTDAACIWAVGTTWWKVPTVVAVRLTGKLRSGVVGKDVIIALCGIFNEDEALNSAVEFTGEGVGTLSMADRLSIANMTTEWGALAGIFPFDEVLRDYLLERAEVFRARGDANPAYTTEDIEALFANRLEADTEANYALELELDLGSVIPQVAGPDGVKVMQALPVIEAKRVKVQRAYLLSCVNARLDDLRDAAAVVAGKQVAAGVKFYVAAASAEVMGRAVKEGTWQKLIDCGAVILPPGCGTCIGLGEGTLEAGEVGISATNRKFKGRMGSRDAETYLASPVVVAASALAGYICGPTSFEEVALEYSIAINEKAEDAKATTETTIIEGFPEEVTGRTLFLPVDNLNTDGIYAGTLTYRDDVTEEEMAGAAMANYDPAFQGLAEVGDILVSGKNFGSGSSREQAVTCLALRGIRCVIAESFSETYRRNAFNNGFIVIECAELARMFRRKTDGQSAATIVGPRIRINYRESTITVGDSEGYGEAVFGFAALSETAQRLIVAGGAEEVARGLLRESS